MQKKGSWAPTHPQLKGMRAGGGGANRIPQTFKLPSFANMKIRTGSPKIHVGYFAVPRQTPSTGHAGSVFGKVFAGRRRR